MKKLTPSEEKAASVFLASLHFPKRKTRRQIMVAMLGVSGSGKSTIARAIAAKIGATVIEKDLIRIALRKARASYDNADVISRRAMMEALGRGSNVALDSDHVKDRENRTLAAAAKALKVQLVFVRVCMDLDVMIGRILAEKHQAMPENFFGGASTIWQGEKELRGNVVKMREMIRRLPHHYRWTSQGGGKWMLKQRSWVFAEIDATDRKEWQKAVKILAAKLKRG